MYIILKITSLMSPFAGVKPGVEGRFTTERRTERTERCSQKFGLWNPTCGFDFDECISTGTGH